MDNLILGLTTDYQELLGYYEEWSPPAITEEDLTEVEEQLSLVLPPDLKRIAVEFGNLDFLLMPQHCIGSSEADSITSVTLLRRTVEKCPNRFVYLAHFDSSFVLMETQRTPETVTPIYWLDYSVDPSAWIHDSPKDPYRIFPSYGEYFKYALGQELLARREFD